MKQTITKFISFHEMIEKNHYPFIIMNTDQSNKNGMHWQSFLNLHLRTKSFLFNILGSKDLKNSSLRTIEKLLTKFYSESKNFLKKITRSRWSP